MTKTRKNAKAKKPVANKKKAKSLKKMARPSKKIVRKKANAVTKKMVRPAKLPAAAAPSAPEGALKVGDQAPDFRILNDAGHKTGISDFRGRKIVLYFYPKDDTPGCTLEASSFRDGIDAITDRGASVIGVSCDPVESHTAFKRKYGLNFHLLSDTHREAVKKYGVWKEENIERTTFLIDEKGMIKKIFPRVDVGTHYGEVLKALR